MSLLPAPPEADRRIEALDDPVLVQPEQTPLRDPPRREEQELELVRRQHLVPVEEEDDLAVAVGEDVRQLNELAERHRPPTAWRTTTCFCHSRTSLYVGFFESPHRPLLWGAAASPAVGTTAAVTPVEAPAEPAAEAARRFHATSRMSSASSSTASRCCSAVIGTHTGGRSRISSTCLATPTTSLLKKSSTTDRPFQHPKSHRGHGEHEPVH